MELNEYILNKARESGICEPWADRISGAGNVEELLKMYVAGIDFCLEHNFPSNEDLVRLSTKEQRLGHGIIVDEQAVLNDPSFLVMLGKCESELAYAGFSTSQLFVKHESKAGIAVHGNAFLVIDCFDNSSIKVTATDNTKVLINVYGSSNVSRISTEGATIKIINKLKSTY